MGNRTRFWVAMFICVALPTTARVVALLYRVDFAKVQGSVTAVEIFCIVSWLIVLLVPRKKNTEET